MFGTTSIFMRSHLKNFDGSRVDPAIIPGETSLVPSIKDNINERLLLPKD